MIYVGIDVAKDKHDCFAMNSDGEILIEKMTIQNNFDSPAKLQAFAGLEPSTYQSGKYTSTHSVMVKRGSKYLRWALLNATRLVCMRDKTFNEYKNKKLAEGKHYFVALSHTSKKLIRVIYYLLKTNKSYQLSKVA